MAALFIIELDDMIVLLDTDKQLQLISEHFMSLFLTDLRNLEKWNFWEKKYWGIDNHYDAFFLKPGYKVDDETYPPSIIINEDCPVELSTRDADGDTDDEKTSEVTNGHLTDAVYSSSYPCCKWCFHYISRSLRHPPQAESKDLRDFEIKKIVKRLSDDRKNKHLEEFINKLKEDENDGSNHAILSNIHRRKLPSYKYY
jgi:hypothetical protein